MQKPAARPAAAPTDQINAELFTLTYGSLVRQLLADFDDVQQVNKQLDQMGHNIGARIVDEFLARARIAKCGSFKDTVEIVARQAFPMFLSVQATVDEWNPEGTECRMKMADNPLADFVEIPEEYAGLSYCALLPGIIRGALEQLNMTVECDISKDMLRGADIYELRLKLLNRQPEQFPFKDDD